ncbi:hypothetical protein E5676_scaffold1032G00370 [Cucumis melo var. makuwa]|uniref:Uncharacterized protein n=1 Tax=Cucumis melo var. makuwa TaxID=1194695 RepID=A0A5A7SVB9_CUCMM|nr:hypothetical protein E6C27_scaffold269G002670 [Cucumis melo var. makuwa]TYK17103.1 hypothetical protein E5676_scaffold1032G00370 [Cucumis melo var. makuwa]
MTSIVRTISKANLQAVMETVIHTISNDNKEDDLDDTRISSDSSIKVDRKRGEEGKNYYKREKAIPSTDSHVNKPHGAPLGFWSIQAFFYKVEMEAFIGNFGWKASIPYPLHISALKTTLSSHINSNYHSCRLVNSFA